MTSSIDSSFEEKMTWVFGTPKSGSTWLSNDILGSRKDLLIHREPMIGANLGAFTLDPTTYWKILANKFSDLKLNRLIDNDRNDFFFSKNYEESWKKNLKQMIIDRLEAQHGSSGFKNLIIRSPNDSHGSDIIMSCFPKSKLIFLVRDGRDVIDSRQGLFFSPRRNTAEKDERKFRFTYYALVWNKMIDITFKAFTLHPESLRLLVKYEDLRLKPDFEIKRILSFLGYDLTKDEIQELADRTKFENVPGEKKGENKIIRQAKVGGFKNYFSKEEQEILTEIMTPNLLKLGYSLD